MRGFSVDRDLQLKASCNPLLFGNQTLFKMVQQRCGWCGALTAPTGNTRECNAQCITKKLTYKMVQLAAVGEQMSPLRLQLDGSNAQLQQVPQRNAALQPVSTLLL